MTLSKRWNLVVMMTLFSALSAAAQENRSERFARIEAEKIAFITKELNLTPTEAQDFFPIYNQYYRELSKLKDERRNQRTQRGRPQLQNQQVPGNALNPTSGDVLAFDAKELELKKQYRNQFAAIVGHARASRFFEVEEEFRNYLLRELQQRKRDRGDE